MKRASLPWMKYFVGDWAKLTAAMSIAERGAYQRLVEHYWTAGSLSSDEAAIARVAGASPDEWSQVRDAVLSMFEADSQAGVWRCELIDDLREKQEREYRQQVEAGRLGAEARKAKRAAQALPSGQGTVLPYPKPSG